MTGWTGSPPTALVTGAGRRIGREIALTLAAEGWRIGVHYGAGAEEAAAVAAEISAIGGTASAIRADLADAAAVTALIPECAGRLGPVSCLINNASLFIEDDIRTLDVGIWDRQLAVNLRAPVLLAQAFARHLPAGLSGNIVNIVDQRVLRPLPGFFSYAVSKEGLAATTRLLAKALAPQIRVNGIAPGPVLQSVHQSKADFSAEAATTLMRRPVAPGEIAAAVRFILASPSLTGQLIAVDAGQHLA